MSQGLPSGAEGGRRILVEPAERLQGLSAPSSQICLLSTWSQRHTVSPRLLGKVLSSVVLRVPAGSIELQSTHDSVPWTSEDRSHQ